MTEHQTQLTSAEIALIWTAYMNDSMSKCMLGYFLKALFSKIITSFNMITRSILFLTLQKQQSLRKEPILK